MSTGQQQSPSATAIRDEVRRTIQQLNELARTEQDFDQFCDTVLSQVVKITGAHSALFWQLNAQRQPRLTHQSGTCPHATASQIVAAENELHIGALMEVIHKKKPMGLASEAFTSRQSDSGQDQDTSDEAFLLLFAPVYDRAASCQGAVELLQRGDVSPAAQEGYLRFLNQVAQLFQRWHEQRDLAHLSAQSDQWQERMVFISEAHRSIDPTETAYAIANEARRLLRCDRVSVGRWNGRRCKISAISSQDRFDNRANVVRLLSNVATSAVKSDSTFWVVGSTEGLAPEVARQINEYLDESHSRTLAVIPLVDRPPETPDLEMRSHRQPQAHKLGALVLEYFDADVPQTQIESDCQLIVDQSELALNNARRHNELFLQPLWKRLGWMQQTLFRDHYAKTMTGLAIAAVVLLTLLFFPKELKMKVDGVLHPTLRKTIFSQTDGMIAEVFVDQHQQVTSGQPLLRLEDPDLETEIATKELELETIDYQLAGAAAQLSQGVEDALQREELGNAINLFRKKQETLKRQLEILNRKKRYQEVISPIDGTVVTPQPKRRLEGYPATRDIALLEVAQLAGSWQLELKIPEGKVGYVDQALADQNGEPLPVEFKIGTNPNLTLYGSLTEVARRAVPSEEGVSEFRAIVQIDAKELEGLQAELRSGTGATARILCGKRSLGFVCFYQVYDFLRTQVFF